MGISRPKFQQQFNQYDDITDQYHSKEETRANVKEAFDIQRQFSTEGYKLKIGINGNYKEVHGLVQEHTHPLHREIDVKKLALPLDFEVERGHYVYMTESLYANDPPWIIFAQERASDGAYWKTHMHKCNYKMKWIEPVTGIIHEDWVVHIPKNSYSPGIWGNTFANFTDAEMACIVPSILPSTQLLERDLRFIISHNKIHPKTFRLTNTQDVIMAGCTVVNFTEDEYNSALDDNINGIADRYLYENAFKITFLSGDKLKLGINQEFQIQPKLEIMNKKTGEQSSSNNYIFKYFVDNNNIIKITEDGTIIPQSLGTDKVKVRAEYSYSEDYTEIVDETEFSVMIIANDIVKDEVVILGDTEIYYTMKDDYKAKLIRNGIEVPEVFTFTLYNLNNTSVNPSVAKIIDKTDDNCTIKVGETYTNIKLVVVSQSTGLTMEKQITIKDVG